MERGLELGQRAECGEKTIREEERGNQHLLGCGGENHLRPTRTSRTSALRGRRRRRDPRKRESHGAEWVQREDATRDTRTMTDDKGARPYSTARCVRFKRPPLLVGRLLAHAPAASFVRATPPRRPLAHSGVGRGGGGVASCTARSCPAPAVVRLPLRPPLINKREAAYPRRSIAVQLYIAL